MSNETAPQVPIAASQTPGWFDDAPGADMNLDDLFPNIEGVPQAQSPAPTTLQEPQVPVAAEVFLQTATGTVYRTAEDAIRGTEEKDRAIATMRQKLTQLEGSDPLRPKPATPAPDGFGEFARKSYGKLVDSAVKGDPEAYIRNLAEVVMAVQQETLAPYAPLMVDISRERAIRSVEGEVSGVRSFVGSAEYRTTLEHEPALREAIEIAESRPESAAQLPQLYRLAYKAAQFDKLPELVRTAAVAATAPNTPRPTLTTSTSAPVTSPTGTAPPSLATKEGRAAIIAEMERRGIREMTF